MYLVQVSKHNILDALVYVGCDREVAIGHFFDTCSTCISNWDEYDQNDKDALLDAGYERFDHGAVLLIDTDGITSDAEISAMINTEPPPGVEKIRRWVESGEIGEAETIDEVLERAGRCLDKVCSHEICGPVVFQAENDKWYVLHIEGVITEARPQYIKDCLAEKSIAGCNE